MTRGNHNHQQLVDAATEALLDRLRSPDPVSAWDTSDEVHEFISYAVPTKGAEREAASAGQHWKAQSDTWQARYEALRREVEALARIARES